MSANNAKLNKFIITEENMLPGYVRLQMKQYKHTKFVL